MEVGTPKNDSEMQSLGEPTVVLNEEDVGCQEQTQGALVGKVITDKSLNRSAIKNMLGKAWGNPDGLQVSDIGPNMFLFTFNSKEEAMEVFHKSPWYVMNKLMSLQEWVPHISLTEINFSRVNFWIQIQGLPLEFISVKCAEKILQHVGVILDIEDPRVDGKLLRPFSRARVEVNIQHPLSTGCWIPRKNNPRIWAFLKYERLQNLCFKCGIIGHEQNTCQKSKVMSAWGRNIQKYGPGVGVAPAKSIQMILEEQERRKKYAQGGHSQGPGMQDQGSQQENVQEKRRMEKEIQLNK